MVEANLETTKQYETLMEEWVKLGTDKQMKAKAKKLIENFLNRFNVKEMVDKLEKDEASSKHSTGEETHKKKQSLIEEMKQMIGQLVENLSQFKRTGIPSEEGVKSNFEKLSKLMAQHLGINWHQVAIFSTKKMSDWQLAMLGSSSLNAFLKIGIESGAKKHIDFVTPKRGSKGQQKHNSENSDKNKHNKYEKWLKNNARFFKTAFDRLFLQIDEGPKKVRRRCKRSGWRARTDWRAWLECISLTLLYIIMILLAISAVVVFFLLIVIVIGAVVGGGGGGGGCGGDSCCCFWPASSASYGDCGSGSCSSCWGGGSGRYSFTESCSAIFNDWRA
ncbi:hypothetical protein niasHT_001075 [Heterodera trifolii]|uniref:Uncharacterized protein n=1 Tax=Heterodera trifolii TaxID=157864 RepID=A0ABD2MCU5_9BILA